jgi:hypothetical protein
MGRQAGNPTRFSFITIGPLREREMPIFKPNDTFFIRFANGCERAIKGTHVTPEEFQKWKNRTLRKIQEGNSKPEIFQEKIQRILDGLIKTKQVNESEDLRFFIEIVEQYKLVFEVEGGKLHKTLALGKGRYLTPLLWITHTEWVKELAFSLIGYLSNPKTDLRKLKQCKWCNKYFLSKKNSGRIKYCASCSPKSKMTKQERSSYQVEYRERKSKEKAKTKKKAEKEKREIEIKRLMNSLDMTREEAVRQLRVDEKL